MTDQLEDWSHVWTEPDSKILTLKRKIEDMENGIAPIMVGTRDQIDSLTGALAELLAYNKVRLLYDLGKIDRPELQRLITMMHSVNAEDRDLATELIKKLHSESS